MSRWNGDDVCPNATDETWTSIWSVSVGSVSPRCLQRVARQVPKFMAIRSVTGASNVTTFFGMLDGGRAHLQFSVAYVRT